MTLYLFFCIFNIRSRADSSFGIARKAVTTVHSSERNPLNRLSDKLLMYTGAIISYVYIIQLIKQQCQLHFILNYVKENKKEQAYTFSSDSLS